MNDPMKKKAPNWNKEPRICKECGYKYIPTSPNQKVCPDCRNAKNYRLTKEDKIRKDTEAMFGPGSYRSPNAELEVMMANGIVSTYVNPNVLPEELTQNSVKTDSVRPAELPDKLQMVDEMAEILRKYYEGELVDRASAREEVLEEIREKLNSL